jgi:hypothetical protein
MVNEHEIQNRIRAAISPYGKYFRVNSGTGWTSNDLRRITVAGRYELQPGDVVLKNARPFTTGVPAGYSDVSGATTITVHPSLVGEKIAVATFIECKVPGKNPTPDQRNFLSAMREAGAIAGVASSEADAINIILGGAR